MIVETGVPLQELLKILRLPYQNSLQANLYLFLCVKTKSVNGNFQQPENNSFLLQQQLEGAKNEKPFRAESSFSVNIKDAIELFSKSV